MATIVLFRVHAVPTKLDARLFIDDIQVATLPDMAHTWVQVPPGKHKLEATFPALSVLREVTLSEVFEAGKTYHVRYEGTVPRGGTALIGPSGAYVGNVGGSGVYSNTLKVVPPDHAEAVFKEFRPSYFPSIASGG